MSAVRHAPMLPMLLATLIGIAGPVLASDRASSHLKEMTLTLPDDGWTVTANGLDDEGDPEFEANRDGQVELTLGELATLPLVTADAGDMLDEYESLLGQAFDRIERQKGLPKDIRAPKGFTCRAYRNVFMAGDTPDSVDLTCYAPYRGGTRTLLAEIKDSAGTEHRRALQRALDAIRLED